LKKFQGCLNAAALSGEMSYVPLRAHMCVWLAQHVAFSLMLHLRPKKPVIDYRASKDELVEQATWFVLRGLGLQDESIRRYYNPKALSLLAG
jgi:hypothetical protein